MIIIIILLQLSFPTIMLLTVLAFVTIKTETLYSEVESQEAAYTCNRILCQLANSRGTVGFPGRCMLVGTNLYGDYV